ncbi:MAG: iron-containing alcohol dehydrogenase [Treponema sp.]|jgi:alcohol dehydrogenase|nr:iron-containing alcohol dehydrogenase [Treponema sp.]
MNELFDQARRLLIAWKGGRYCFGRGALPEAGRLAARFGEKALAVCNSAAIAGRAVAALEAAGIRLAGGSVVPGAGPNTPRSDVFRIATAIIRHRPDLIIAIGGGSTIDACKAANCLAVLGTDKPAEIDPCFGTGLVSAALEESGGKLYPLLAIQTAAGSGAHLTKYANVTDTALGQKKLIVDDAIVPPCALFDYDLSASAPLPITLDGIMDSIAHCFEAFSGLPADAPQEKRDLAALLTKTAVGLTLRYAPLLVKDPANLEAREALGLAADLGGYAIMTGGTHGPHMISFSLVDLAGHGSACGIMNPYFAAFFAPAIEPQLRVMGNIFKQYGYISENLERLSTAELGLAVAKGMIAFGKAAGAPTALQELPRWNNAYVDKILEAAKDPQLAMKLKNMPIPLNAGMVDQYLRPVILAAVSGDFSLLYGKR